MKKEKLDPIALVMRNAAIAKAREAGIPAKEIAAEYGLHPGQVDRIVRQRAKWIKGGAATNGKPAPRPLSKRSKLLAARESNGKPLGALESAILMLRKLDPLIALHPREMIERLEGNGLWKSPGGKTPHATLWSNILSELKKGRSSRLRKVGPGRFGLTKVGRDA